MSVLTDPNAGKSTEGGSGGSGNQTPPDWRTGLPEDLRGHKSLETIKGKDWNEAGPSLVKSFIHAQSLVGADKLVIPGKDATKEQIAEFRTKLGVPEKPDGYEVKLPEGLTEDKIDKKLMDTWRTRLHEAGIPKSQAEKIISDYLSDNLSVMTAQQKAAEKQAQDWEIELKQKFGADYDKQVNYARYALRQLGSDSLLQLLESTGLGNNPTVVEFFAKAGRSISDDTARGGGGGGGAGGIPRDPAAAQAAIDAFNRDERKQKALWKREDPLHDEVVKERDALFKAAYPDI